jgi:hypothetical protein
MVHGGETAVYLAIQAYWGRFGRAQPFLMAWLVAPTARHHQNFSQYVRSYRVHQPKVAMRMWALLYHYSATLKGYKFK